MKRLILFRHGETDSNLKGIWQCSDDIPLNDNGIAQAEFLGRNFPVAGCNGIFSSEMSRAIETAKIASRLSGISYLGTYPGFGERNCGEISGLDYFQIEEKFGIQLRSILSKDVDRIPGSEKYDSFTRRVRNSVNELFNRGDIDVAGIVTHGGVTAYVHQWVTGTNELKRLPNCGMLILERKNGELLEV
jgi:broad specificity phosphatase PhoE